MTESSDSLSCLLLPMTDCHLLLPAVSVAETLELTHTLQPVTGYPGVIGRIHWRGQSLPVLSWELINQSKVRIPEGGRGRILVLKTIGEHREQLPFMALTSQDRPQAVDIQASQLKALDEEAGPADQMAVTLDDTEAIIPDLPYLETLAIAAVRS